MLLGIELRLSRVHDHEMIGAYPIRLIEVKVCCRVFVQDPFFLLGSAIVCSDDIIMLSYTIIMGFDSLKCLQKSHADDV